jgi:hypothetical protein
VGSEEWEARSEEWAARSEEQEARSEKRGVGSEKRGVGSEERVYLVLVYINLLIIWQFLGKQNCITAFRLLSGQSGRLKPVLTIIFTKKSSNHLIAGSKNIVWLK